MKTQVLSIILMAVSIIFSGTFGASAQDNEKKKTHIKIVKEVDGKKTVVDTVFYSDSDLNLKEIMEGTVEFHKLGEDLKHLEDIHIAIDQDHLDSLSYKIQIMTDKMEIALDEELEKKLEKLEKEIEIHIEGLDSLNHKIMEKMIIVGDGEEKIIMLDDGHIQISEAGDENIEVFVTTDGDNEHVKIIKDGKVVKSSGSKVMVIKESDHDHDAEFVTVDVMLDDDGKETHHKMVIALSNLDKKEKDVIRDLGIDFKKKDLDLDEFFITRGEKKNRYEIGFTLESKGAVEVGLFDEDGKSIFKDIDKDFNGEYKGTMKLKEEGDFYLVITQGKASSVNKFMIETIE